MSNRISGSRTLRITANLLTSSVHLYEFACSIQPATVDMLLSKGFSPLRLDWLGVSVMQVQAGFRWHWLLSFQPTTSLGLTFGARYEHA